VNLKNIFNLVGTLEKVLFSEDIAYPIDLFSIGVNLHLHGIDWTYPGTAATGCTLIGVKLNEPGFFFQVQRDRKSVV